MHGVRLPGHARTGCDVHISIHAQRQRCICRGRRPRRPETNSISTRPARGATVRPLWISMRVAAFQSTHPVRGATNQGVHTVNHITVSIHAPRAGRDAPARPSAQIAHYFNPCAPCRARPSPSLFLVASLPFQSTRPARGATGPVGIQTPVWCKFQSTRRDRGAFVGADALGGPKRTQSPRAPRGARLCLLLSEPDVQRISIHALPCGARLSISPRASITS